MRVQQSDFIYGQRTVFVSAETEAGLEHLYRRSHGVQRQTVALPKTVRRISGTVQSAGQKMLFERLSILHVDSGRLSSGQGQVSETRVSHVRQ